MKKFLYFLLGLATFSCVSGGGSCSGDLEEFDHGELANGTFSYECIDEELDPVCENLLGMPLFQERIAVGATFSMWFIQHDAPPNSMESFFIQSPFPSQLERTFENSTVYLRFLTPCLTPVHATNMDNAVYDFLHLEGVEIDHLILAKLKEGVESPWGSWDNKWESIDEEILIVPDQTVTLRVFPRDVDEEILPGTISDYEWIGPDESIAAMSATTANTNILIRGIAIGASTLEVKLGGLSKTINVVVEEDIDGGPDAGYGSPTEGGGAK